MTVALHEGDCLAVLPALRDEGVRVDAVVTDPPYHLTSIVKRFGSTTAAPAKGNPVYKNLSAGFMGQQWDGGDIAFRVETWREVYRLMKPGAWLLAFSGTRTYHRMACAIEDAGFDIRDLIAWLYSTGFPKSRDVAKDLRRLGLAELAEEFAGYGTALKPALEPLCMARKPFPDTVGRNVASYRTGALDIDGCSIEPAPGSWDYLYAPGDHGIEGRERQSGFKLAAGKLRDAGRWPANVIHDGLAEVIEAFGETEGKDNSRFFYSAKADDGDRFGSKHPTVKPIDLIAYLVRLICPAGGTVLDPFAGSGTTGVAALREGRSAILIEREAGYCADIRARLAYYQGEGKHKLAELQRNTDAGELAELPLFGAGAEGGGR